MTLPIKRLILSSDSPARTESLGKRLGAMLLPRDVICLSGGLGAGKTVFCRGAGAGWGAHPPLSSPTYNLAHEHRRAHDDEDALLYHLDFYRFSDAGDAASLGFDELLDSGAVLIMEWSEIIMQALPPERLWLDIAIDDGERRVLEFEAQGARYHQLLADYARTLKREGRKS